MHAHKHTHTHSDAHVQSRCLLPSFAVRNCEASVIEGSYEYCHYMQVSAGARATLMSMRGNEEILLALPQHASECRGMSNSPHHADAGVCLGDHGLWALQLRELAHVRVGPPLACTLNPTPVASRGVDQTVPAPFDQQMCVSASVGGSAGGLLNAWLMHSSVICSVLRCGLCTERLAWATRGARGSEPPF